MADLYAGRLRADAELNTERFRQGISRIRGSMAHLGAGFQKAFGRDPQRALQETEKAAKRVTWTIRGYIKDTSRVITGILISQVFYQTLRQVRMMTAAMWENAKAVEQTTIAYELLLGNQKEANEYMYALIDFVAKTPFEWEGVDQAAKRLLAVGFTAEQTIPILRTLADTTALMGGDPVQLERLNRAIYQIAAKGRLQGIEVRQLMEAGIPAAEILTEKLGLTTDELVNISQAQIPAGVAIAALLEGMHERFEGAAELIERTVGGMTTTIRDNFLMLSRILTEGLFERYRAFLESFLDRIVYLNDVVMKYGVHGFFQAIIPERMFEPIMHLIQAVQLFVKEIGKLYNAFRPLITVLSDAFIYALSAVSTTMLVVLRGLNGLIQGLQAAYYWAVTNIPGFSQLAYVLRQLLVAFLAAQAMYLVYSAMRLMVIAGPLAFIFAHLKTAISALTRAVMALNIALLFNVKVLIIALVGLGIVLAANRIWNLKASFDGLWNSIKAGLGFTKPVTRDLTNLGESSDKFNQSLEDVLDSIRGIGSEASDEMDKAGDGAGKAADKAEKGFKKFLASFDEVYNVPDALDSAADSLSGIGDTLDADLFEELPLDAALAGIGDGIDPGVYFDDLFDGLFPETDVKAWWQKLWDGLKGIYQDFIVGTLNDIWSFFDAVSATLRTLAQAFFDFTFTTMKRIWDLYNDIRAIYHEFVELTWDSIIDTLKTTAKHISWWATITTLHFEDWWETIKGLWEEFKELTIDAFIDIFTITVERIRNWATNTYSIFSGWWEGTKEIWEEFKKLTMGNIIESLVVTWEAIKKWVSNTMESYEKWGEGLLEIFKDIWDEPILVLLWRFIKLTYETIKGWVSDTLDLYEEWKDDIAAIWDGWWEEAVTLFEEFITNTKEAIEEWIKVTVKEWEGWKEDVWEVIEEWYIEAKRLFDTAVEETKKTIESWIGHTERLYESWKTEVIEIWEEWYEGVKDLVEEAIKTTKKHIEEWIIDMEEKFEYWKGVIIDIWKKWYEETESWFIKTFKENYDRLVTWVKDMYKKFVEWYDDTIELIVEWAKGIESTFEELWGDLWTAAEGFWSDLSSLIKRTINDIIDWVNILIRAWNKLGFETPDWARRAGFADRYGTINVKEIPKLETGGIVRKHSVVEVGEGNKPEAVVPLTGPHGQKFANMIAERIGDIIGDDRMPPLYVGTLITDERGLVELERRMKVVRADEAIRGSV